MLKLPKLRMVTCRALIATFLLTGCAPTSDEPGFRGLTVVSVDRVRQQGGGFTVFLRETEGQRRILPIAIGSTQAQSISLALREVAPRRPNTHDLVKSVLDGLAGKLERVVITELRGGIYFAQIELQIDGRSVQIDARPSDAIAIAVRTGAPVFASRLLFERNSDRIEADHMHPNCPADPAPQSREQTVV